MAHATVPEEITKELKAIRNDLNYIKTHMVDVDSIMTGDDYIALEEYEKEKSEKSLVSHEQLKKELGL